MLLASLNSSIPPKDAYLIDVAVANNALRSPLSFATLRMRKRRFVDADGGNVPAGARSM